VDYFFIGEEELLAAFRFAGVDGVAVRDAAGALSAFHEAAAAGCRVLILTEEAEDLLGQEAVDWQLSGRYPLLVSLPGLAGRKAGRKSLVDTIREAIGVHV